MSNRSYWSEKEDEILKKYYLLEDGISSILKTLPNRTYNAIKARANTVLNLKRHIAYTKNESFFEIPNIVNCAISGFIEADGNIKEQEFENGVLKSNGNISIGIHGKDIKMLETIKSLTSYNGKIYTRIHKTKIKDYRSNSGKTKFYETRMAYLSFFDTMKWRKDLEKNWNITPKKSLTMKAPNLSSLEHILAYYSGAICGDGSITLNKNILRIDLLGTLDFLSFFKTSIKDIAPSKTNINLERKGSKIYSFRTSGVSAYLLAKVMLCLDVPRLDRKWDVARNYIKSVESTPQHHRFIFQLKNKINHQTIDFLRKYNEEVPHLEIKKTSPRVLESLKYARTQIKKGKIKNPSLFPAKSI